MELVLKLMHALKIRCHITYSMTERRIYVRGSPTYLPDFAEVCTRPILSRAIDNLHPSSNCETMGHPLPQQNGRSTSTFRIKGAEISLFVPQRHPTPEQCTFLAILAIPFFDILTIIH